MSLYSTEEPIYFYRAKGEFGFLSNLYPCHVTYPPTSDNAIVFESSEHAYQYQKTNKTEIAEYIRNAPHARLAAIVGHGLFGYDIVDDWDEIKVKIMRSILTAKFEQNPDLRLKLLATRGRDLIENSKTDPFWGLGKKGTGRNRLGHLLMEVRSGLKEKYDKEGYSRLTSF